MSKKNDGGPAFARAGFEKSDERQSDYDGYPQEGLSMRDYFAAHIVGHCLANPNQSEEFVREVSAIDQATIYAENAYLLADAMLIARAK